jgi:hypothetical protein
MIPAPKQEKRKSGDPRMSPWVLKIQGLKVRWKWSIKNIELAPGNGIQRKKDPDWLCCPSRINGRFLLHMKEMFEIQRCPWCPLVVQIIRPQ